MVTTAPQDTSWLPTGELRAGRYFKLTTGWHLCLEQARRAPDNAPYPWTVKVATPDGHIGHKAVYGNRVPAAAHGTRPDAFNPATMRRKAKEDERRAEGLLNQAGARRRLANKIEHGAQIR